MAASTVLEQRPASRAAHPFVPWRHIVYACDTNAPVAAATYTICSTARRRPAVPSESCMVIPVTLSPRQNGYTTDSGRRKRSVPWLPEFSGMIVVQQPKYALSIRSALQQLYGITREHYGDLPS